MHTSPYASHLAPLATALVALGMSRRYARAHRWLGWGDSLCTRNHTTHLGAMWDGITTVPSACGHRSRVAPRHIWKGNMTGRVRLSGTGHGERGGSFLGSARGMPAGASGNHHTTAWDPTAPLDPSRTNSARREFPQGTRPPSSERTGTLLEHTEQLSEHLSD